MTSKSARKRRKKAAKVTLPGGAAIPQPAKTGRPRGKPEDVRKTAIGARVRRSGIQDTQRALDPLLGTDLGLCVDAMTTGDERAALANTWAALSASRRNYRALVLNKTGNPQGAAIAMLPDPMQTDTGLRVDLRTLDEKVAAAKASWSAWEARIKALPVPGMIWALRGALDGFMGEDTLWRNRQPTDKGRMAVEALRRVAG